MIQKMFKDIEPLKGLNESKLRELAHHLNINPKFQIPTILKKEAVHVSESPGMQAAQDVLQNILSENLGFKMYKTRLAQTHFKIKYDPMPDAKRNKPKDLEKERTTYLHQADAGFGN